MAPRSTDSGTLFRKKRRLASFISYYEIWTSQKVKIMKKLFKLVCIGIIAMTLVACRSGISNEQLKIDIKSLASLEESAQVNEITIIEKKETDGKLVYKLSVLLSSLLFTTTADIELTYTKSDGKYELSQNTVDIIKETPNQSIQINPIYQEAVKTFSESFFYRTEQSTNQSGAKSTLSLVSAHLASDKTHGTGTVVISETYKDDIFSADALYTVQATYIVGSGWSYEVIDWQYHDSTKWSGVYDIHWTQEVPGYPLERPNSFYKLDQDLKGIQITGECSVSRKMGQPDNDVVENNVQIDYDYAGVHLSGQPKCVRMSNRLFFEMSFNPDTLLILEYTPFYQVNNLNDPGNSFYGGASYLEGILTKRPN